MRKLMVAAAVAMTVAMGGAALWQADASGAAGNLPAVARGMMSKPVRLAACNGTTGGAGCGPGYIRRCNAYRCWCGPC